MSQEVSILRGLGAGGWLDDRFHGARGAQVLRKMVASRAFAENAQLPPGGAENGNGHDHDQRKALDPRK